VVPVETSVTSAEATKGQRRTERLLAGVAPRGVRLNRSSRIACVRWK
jgi:hypothetical protein